MLLCLGIYLCDDSANLATFLSQPGDLYRRDLHLINTFEVDIFGIGGRTVDKTIRFDLDTIRNTVPNMVVLEMVQTMCSTEIATPMVSHPR